MNRRLTMVTKDNADLGLASPEVAAELHELVANVERLTRELAGFDAAILQGAEQYRKVRDERDEVVAYAVLALEAMRKAHDHLMNLQPHIPVACYPGHEGFIDSHVNEAMRVLDAALAKNPDPSVSRTGEAPGALSGSGERDRPICAKCGMPYAASAQYTRCPGCDAPLEEKNAQSSDWVCICPVDGKACPDSGLCMNVGPCTSAVEAARIRAYVKEARDESEGGNS